MQTETRLYPDFLNIATPLVKRGWPVLPIRPSEKTPHIIQWTKHPIESLADLSVHALDKAHDNAAVLGRRKVGQLLIWDIDAPSVLPRMTAETGQELPKTYCVQSRPQTKPYKLHAYFVHTSYSVGKFRKEMNVKDCTQWGKTRNSEGFLTLYDIKGSGKGGYAVAAGSLHPNGETYTAVDPNAEAVPVPNWLVDWLLADHAEQLSACKKARYAKRQAEKPAKGTDLPPIHLKSLIWKCAWAQARLGFKRDDIEKITLQYVAHHFGNAVAKNSSAIFQVHEAAFSRRLKISKEQIEPTFTINNIPFFRSRTQELVILLGTFPAELSAEDAEARVRKTWDYDKTKSSARKMLSEVRKVTGFSIVNDSGKKIWRRSV